MSISDEDEQVTIAAFAASILSFFGALLILCHHACASTRRTFFMRLVASLTVANLLTAVAYAMSMIEWRVMPVAAAGLRAWCLAQAVLLVVFEDASILWTAVIAITLHQQVVARRGLATERLEGWLHAVCWGVPGVTALALLLTNNLGPADAPRRGWCWITAGDLRWRQLGLFYLPLALVFVLNLASYVRVGRAFARLAREGVVDAAKEHQVQIRIRLYLLVFLVVWAPPLAHRLLQAFGVDPFWLRLLHTVSQCSMGSLNCLVYGCNRATLGAYRHAIERLSCSVLGGGLQMSRGRARLGAQDGTAAAAAAADAMGIARAGGTMHQHLLLDAASPAVGPEEERGPSTQQRA